jgi:hypothetical protein
LTALAADALAGLDVGYVARPVAARTVARVANDDRRHTPAEAGIDVGAPGRAIRALAGGLAELGARIAADDAPVDLLLVPVDGSASLDAAADGTLAVALTAAFTAARDGASRLRPGGCLLFVLSPADPPARAAIASLTRTLALEWSPNLRVNAIACANPAAAVDLAALLAWRASRTLTGAVLETSGADEYGSTEWQGSANPGSTGRGVSSPNSSKPRSTATEG